MNLIDIQNITLGYESNMVIKNLSFKLENNDYLYIIGENGAGKSTLIKGILGLLKISKGKIIISKHIKQTQMGYLPQMTTAQKNFPASVYEVVLSGCLNSRGISPIYTKENKQLVLDNLKRLGILHLKKKCFRELSGGQQRRVLLARSLCSMKKLLILDEPVSGLDPKATEELYKTIESLNKKDKITVIMVSHDISSAIKYGTHILHLSDEKTFFGTVDEYKKSNHIKNLSGGNCNND